MSGTDRIPGYFGPQAFGFLRDHTGNNVAGLIFLAEYGFIGMLIELLLGYNAAISRNLATGNSQMPAYSKTA